MPSPKDWTPVPTCSHEVAETIAAVSVNLGHSKNTMKAYRAAVHHMGGFVGFYRAGAEMGLALETYARINRIVWGEGFDWVGTTEKVAEYILDFMIRLGRLPATAKERTELIEASLVRD